MEEFRLICEIVPGALVPGLYPIKRGPVRFYKCPDCRCVVEGEDIPGHIDWEMKIVRILRMLNEKS